LEELGLDPKKSYWLIEKRSREWADHLGLDYVCYDVGFPQNLWSLAGRFSVVVNSEQRFGLAQAAAVLMAAKGGRIFSFETNRGAQFADERIPYDPLSSHETIEFSRLLIQSLKLLQPIPDRIMRQRRFPPSGKPVVGLGGFQSKSRSLSKEQWSRLIRDWSRGRDFYITSSPQDTAFAQNLAERFPGRAQPILRPFSQLCQLVQTAEEILTMDSGFLHIASYYGVPTTGLFTSGRAEKFLPLAPHSRLVKRSDLTCQPCALFGQVPPCPYAYACKELDFSAHKINI